MQPVVSDRYFPKHKIFVPASGQIHKYLLVTGKTNYSLVIEFAFSQLEFADELTCGCVNKMASI